MNKTWGFSYRSMDAMKAENPDYDPESGDPYEVCDAETFESKSEDFLEACKEFDEFERNVEMWDVDPEASLNHGECYRNIEGIVRYNEF